MKISTSYITRQPWNNFHNNKGNYNNNPLQTTPVKPVLMSYPLNWYLSFGARVDKDLNSFYERNTEEMPFTVKSYVESLSAEEKAHTTPLQAQRNAYELLEICDSVKDIQDAFPDEPLFKNLKSANNSNATTGLLYNLRLMKEDFKDSGKEAVKGCNDLTVYLVKKAFLEAKTIDEINEDLDKDLNPVFKNPEKKYVLPSTFKALGIKLPDNAYLTSLRYTREGYADKIGEIMSAKWQELSDEEKQARIEALLSNRKDMSSEQEENLKKQHSELMKKMWENFTPEEKTAYINKMQTGSLDQKFAMINAWNKCPDIRTALSDYLRKNNFHRSESIIYREKSFSESMSKIMTEFWAENSEFAEILGKTITSSYEEIETAKENGTYEELKKSILDKQSEIKKSIKKSGKPQKNVKTRETQKTKTPAPQLSTSELLRQLYTKTFPFLPKEYLDAYFEAPSIKNMGEEAMRLWIKYYEGERLTEKENAVRIKSVDPKAPGQELLMEQNAVIFAMADELTRCAGKADSGINFYSLGFDELTSIIRHLQMKGVDNPIPIRKAHFASQMHKFKFVPSTKNIKEAYNIYSQPMTQEEIDNLTAEYSKISGKKDKAFNVIYEFALRRHGKYMCSLSKLNAEKTKLQLNDGYKMLRCLKLMQIDLDKNSPFIQTLDFDEMLDALIEMGITGESELARKTLVKTLTDTDSENPDD